MLSIIFLSMDIHFLFPAFQYLIYLFLLYLVTTLCTKSGQTHPQPKLPPGPWKLPIIGNLHQLLGSLPHHAFKSLAKTHGPLMYLKLGQLPTVVVSSPQMAKQITKTHDVAFADRAELMLAKIVLYNSTDIAASPYGEYWKQMRKLSVREYLNHRKVREFHGLMEDQVLGLVHCLRSRGGTMPVNLTEKIVSMEFGIISRAMVGRVIRKDLESSLIAIIKEAVAMAAVFNFAELFPSMKFLHFLSAAGRRKLENMHLRVDCILEQIITQHQHNRNPAGNDEKIADEEYIVDVLLKATEIKSGVPVTRHNIKANIFEMFIAGIETSSLVIEWAMSELMKNPRVRHKAQEEVRQVLQGKQSFRETDIRQLKYLKMVIKETMRLHPPGPLLCPRRCREQSKIHGYDIPVGTVVMINVWAIGRDPKVWHEPDKFEPERFQDVAIDYNGNHFELIPFGAGRRICPGSGFGLAGVELCLAHLLYHFNWEIPGGQCPEEFDMTENFGASGGRKNNLCLIAKWTDGHIGSFKIDK